MSSSERMNAHESEIYCKLIHFAAELCVVCLFKCNITHLDLTQLCHMQSCRQFVAFEYKINSALKSTERNKNEIYFIFCKYFSGCNLLRIQMTRYWGKWAAKGRTLINFSSRSMSTLMAIYLFTITELNMCIILKLSNCAAFWNNIYIEWVDNSLNRISGSQISLNCNYT
jgi:hypothetical protein